MSRRPSPTAVGIFVIAGIALALVAFAKFGGRRWSHHTARVVVFFDQSVAGLKEGTVVKFRGVEIGHVKDVQISMKGAVRDPERVHIPVILELDQDRIAAKGAHVDLNSRTQVHDLVNQGLRAEIASDDLVSTLRGKRYVSLDIQPHTPATLVGDRTLDYPEIPTLRGKLGETQDKINALVDHLSEADIASAVKSIENVANDAHELLGSPDVKRAIRNLDDVTASLNRTVGELESTMRDFKPVVAGAAKLVAPEGTIVSKLDATLEEVAGSARAMRRLADQLSRDPGAIVRGGRQ